MLSTYLIIKLIHIVSATVLFGTGLGIAFFMYKAYRSGNAEAVRITSRHVVLADWWFTTPAIAVQLISGIWLVDYLDLSWSSPWLIAVAALFTAVGLCWLPVVVIQIRIARATPTNATDPALRRLMHAWIALGIPAFAMTLALFALMVLKPGLR